MEQNQPFPTWLSSPHDGFPIIGWERKELIDEDEELATEAWIMRGYDNQSNEYSGVADFKFGELIDDIYDIEKVNP